MFAKPLWGARVASAALHSVLIGIGLGLLIVSGIHILAVGLIILIQSYRLFSSLRIIKNRIHKSALRNKTLRTELVLSATLLSVVILEQSGLLTFFEPRQWLILFASAIFVTSLIIYMHTKDMSHRTELRKPKKFLSDDKLPSLTVAIPARNETLDLNDCLRSILDTSYPKLEVLVIDDCSQDNTAEIIKKFAHEGVRFVSGKVPAPSWLAKNFAYHQLLDEAGGSYVLFCGTDVRFTTDSLRLLVQNIMESERTMASVLPIRESRLDSHFLLQPMRYWRELALPRLFDRTPPSLSTCWIAKRSFLQEAGGFEAHKKSIRPERIFARLAFHNNQYLFIRAASGLGISSVKNLQAQWATATRTRYPELKSRPETVLASTLFWTALVISPPGLVFAAFAYASPVLLIFGLAIAFILILIHDRVTVMSTGQRSLLKLVTFPVSIVLELAVTNYSMWAYEYSEVIWKGRNVCLPVLQGNLRLPKV